MKYSDRHSLSPGNNEPLSPKVFDLLRNYIHEKTGIYFHDNKQYLLQSRLKPRLRELNLSSYEDYYKFLRSPNKRQEFFKMVNAVTINETFFFRSSEQFELIETHILPQLIALHGHRRAKIHIWSAACSTGDEPYTLAIIIKEYFAHRYPNIQFQITATDIDSEALAAAKAGLFKSYATRYIHPFILKKYFTPEGSAHRINDSIKQLVDFKLINLSDRTEMMRIHNVDLTLCANVLVYFPSEMKERVVKSIFKATRKGGFFMVGHAETLFGLEHDFTQARIGKAIFYQKI